MLRINRLVHEAGRLALVFSLLLYLVLILAGCGQSTRTVTVPAPEPTVNVEAPSDTTVLSQVPPLPVRGSVTLPEEVTIYEEATGPTIRLRRFVVDRRTEDEKITAEIVSSGRTLSETWPLVAPGERFSYVPRIHEVNVSGRPRGTSRPGDTAEVPELNTLLDTLGRARIDGSPESRDVEAIVSEKEGWFGLKTEFALIGLLASILAILGAVHRFITPFLPLP